MKSFTNFMSEDFLAFEAIKYIDRKLFRNIENGKYLLSKEELEKYILNEANENKESRSHLENDDEIELIKIYQKDPNSKDAMDAADKLIRNKLPYIQKKVNDHIQTHPHKSSYRKDLEQEASLAIFKAMQNFDVESKNIFNAFAKKYIMTAILNYQNPNRHKIDKLQTVSLDSPVSGSRGDYADKDTSISDIIPDETGIGNFFEKNENDEVLQRRKILLNDWLKQLPPNEEKAIRMYFLTEKENGKSPTFEEIGKEFGMGKMGAKKLVDRVIEKLKKFCKEQKLVEKDL